MSVYHVFACKYITLFHDPNWLDRSMDLQPYTYCTKFSVLFPPKAAFYMVFGVGTVAPNPQSRVQPCLVDPLYAYECIIQSCEQRTTLKFSVLEVRSYFQWECLDGTSL